MENIHCSEERIDLNNIVHFQLEVEDFPKGESNGDIVLQIELIVMEGAQWGKSIYESKTIASKRFRINEIESGVVNYCEAEFDGDFSSKVSFILVGCISNYKFSRYLLKEDLTAVYKEDPSGKITKIKNSNEEKASRKLRERAKVTNFAEFLLWVKKYYSHEMKNVEAYFYNTYVKNLRLYFYLFQMKLRSNSTKIFPTILKVPTDYLEFPSSPNEPNESVSEQTFKKYIQNYNPSPPPEKLILEIHEIYQNIYIFLFQCEEVLVKDLLMSEKMKNEYRAYERERYGERVFKSVVDDKESSLSSTENKRITQKVRSYEKTLTTSSYPVEDVGFMEGLGEMELVFYEIALCGRKKPLQPEFPHLITQQEKEDELLSENSKNPLILDHQKLELIREVSASSEPAPSIKEESELNDSTDKDSLQSFKSEELQGFEDFSDIKISNPSEKITEKEENVKIEEKFENVVENFEETIENISQNVEEKQQTNENTNLISEEKQEKYEKFFERDQEIREYNEENMLIVLCHGFQGSFYDMIVVMKALKKLLPQASYLISRVNEGRTEGNIVEMGKGLSEEILAYIKNYMDESNVIISLVGHSMGGLIARSSLKYISEKFKNQFGFFCSLSSPHLGYLHGVDGMIKAGLWAILKFKPILSLQQMNMEDNKDLRKTFIYQLSKDGSLKLFRKIILFSSHEDSYVSWNSARISPHSKNAKSKLSKIEHEMIQSILGNNNVHRIDVNFNVKTNNLDSFIGRTAHINLIVQPSLFKVISYTIPELFDIRQP